jgi:hypothetical protein
MVEFGLMRLDFREIAIVKVAGVLESVSMPEHYNTAGSISHCQVFARAIESYRRQAVCLRDVRRVPLSQTVNIDPVQGILRET